MTNTATHSEQDREIARKLLLDLFSEADWDEITIVADVLAAVRLKESERCASVADEECAARTAAANHYGTRRLAGKCKSLMVTEEVWRADTASVIARRIRQDHEQRTQRLGRSDHEHSA